MKKFLVGLSLIVGLSTTSSLAYQKATQTKDELASPIEITKEYQESRLLMVRGL